MNSGCVNANNYSIVWGDTSCIFENDTRYWPLKSLFCMASFENKVYTSKFDSGSASFLLAIGRQTLKIMHPNGVKPHFAPLRLRCPSYLVYPAVIIKHGLL